MTEEVREAGGQYLPEGRGLPRSLRSNWLAHIGLLGASLLVVAGFCEVVARAVFPAPLPWYYPQLRYRSDPKLVFTLVPNQESFTADKPVRINERGLRGGVVPFDRTPGRLRVLFLGDSITFGYGVTDDEVVTTRTSRLLAEAGRPNEVINAAVPAYNTAQEVEYYFKEGARYSADWVVLGVCWNDVNDKAGVRVGSQGWLLSEGERDPAHDDSFWESASGYAVRNLLKRSRALYGGLNRWRALRSGGGVDQHTALQQDVLVGRDTPRVEAGWRQVEQSIARLSETAGAAGSRVLVVAFPMPILLARSFPNSSYPRRLQDVAQRGGVPLVDLEPVYRARFHGHESLFIAYDGDHPNAAGHELAAREIAERIRAADGPAPRGAISGPS